MVLLFNAVVVIPVVITKLPLEEINVWLLFATIVAMSQFVLFGFNGTFSRFIAYSYGGVRISEFRELRYKHNIHYQSVEVTELAEIYHVMKRVYQFLAVVYFFIIMIVGVLALHKPIGAMGVPEIGWISWVIVVVSTSFTLLMGYYQILLEGVNKVTLVQRIYGLVNFIGAFVIVLVLWASPNLISIVLVYQSVAVFVPLCMMIFAKQEMKEIGFDQHQTGFNKVLFRIVWDSAWKSGVTVIIANIITQISAVLVAQLFSASVSATFLFTKRMFDIIERFTLVTFQARLPVIARYRGRGDLNSFLSFFKQTQWISYGVFFIGYIGLLLFGSDILNMIDSNVELGDCLLIIIFSFVSILARWGGMIQSASNQSNHVVEHISASIVIVIFFAFIYAFYQYLGLYVFPLALMVSLIVNVPLIAKIVYPHLRTTFLRYEMTALLPVLFTLSVINTVYYWSCQ